MAWWTNLRKQACAAPLTTAWRGPGKRGRCIRDASAKRSGTARLMLATEAARLRFELPPSAVHDQAVRLMIFLLVPEAATQKHLEILSEIAELLSDSALRNKLNASADASELHALISHWNPTPIA